jgi:hypothetical protein
LENHIYYTILGENEEETIATTALLKRENLDTE